MDDFRITPRMEDDRATPTDTPEDVAVLFSWANVRGKYRDFSASRREYRAQQRHRVVEARRQAEQEAALALEVSAEQTLEILRQETDARTLFAASLRKAEAAPRGGDVDTALEVEVAQHKAAELDDLTRALERTRREVEAARKSSDSDRATSYADLARRRRELPQNEADAVAGAADGPYGIGKKPLAIADPRSVPGPLDRQALAPDSGERAPLRGGVSPESRGGDSYAGKQHAAERGQDAAERGEDVVPPGAFDAGGRNVFSRGMGMDAARGPEREQWGRTQSAERRAVTRDVTPMSGAPMDGAEVHVGERRSDVRVDRQGDALGDGQPNALTHAKPREEAPIPPRPSEAVIETAKEPVKDAVSSYGYGPASAVPRPSEVRDVEVAFKRQAAEDERNAPLARVTRQSEIPLAVKPHPTFFSDDGTGGDLVPEARRRRESATDRSARTERRPRSQELPVVSFEFRRGGTNGFGEPRVPDVHGGTQDRTSGIREGIAGGNGDGPEWLLRNRPADASRDHLRTDAREIATGARERLEEQQRMLAEARRATEIRIAEEERRAAEEAMRSGIHVPSGIDPRELDRRPAAAAFDVQHTHDAVANRRDDGLRSDAAMPDVGSWQAEPRSDDETGRDDESGRDEKPSRADELKRDEERHRSLDEERASLEREHYFELRQHRMEQSLMGGGAREGDTPRSAANKAETVPVVLPAQELTYAATDASMAEERSPRDGARYAQTVMEASEAPPQSDRRRTPRTTPPAFVVPAEGALPASIMVNAAPRPQVMSAAQPHYDAGNSVAGADADTLQQSRERMAARWYALQGRMNGGELARVPAQADMAPVPQLAPSLSVVALGGGTGKTSLVATLGRALSSAGEKVLLADATTHGLLPYYYGAQELRPDVVRTFTPPPGCVAAPVFMVNYELEELGHDEARQHAAVEAMLRHARGASRVLLDLNRGSAWMARVLTQFHSNVLVPIAPDMNSVISLQSVERFFAGCTDGEGQPVAPHYVLNQFDASMPLHLDVREVLRQQLGDRLLPVTIRRSVAVPEALADGMTVLDYAADSPVAEDYEALAEWVRAIAPPVTTGLRSVRWSER